MIAVSGSKLTYGNKKNFIPYFASSCVVSSLSSAALTSNNKDSYAEARVTELQFTERLLLRHVLILGTTGSGKTTHACHVIRSALERAPQAMCFIVDVKKEYRRLAEIPKMPTRIMAIGDEPRAKFNPLAPPKEVKATLWDRAFADVFVRAYGLAEPSRRILLDSLVALRRESKLHPTLRELERKVASFEPGSRNEQNSQRSLESRLHLVNAGLLGDSLNSEDVFDPTSQAAGSRSSR
jgi:type IV secretory pathway VirB4 component